MSSPPARNTAERRPRVVLPLLASLAVLAAVTVGVDAYQDARAEERVRELAPPAEELDLASYLPGPRADPTAAAFEALAGAPGTHTIRTHFGSGAGTALVPAGWSTSGPERLAATRIDSTQIALRDRLLSGHELDGRVATALAAVAPELDVVAAHARSPGGALDVEDVLSHRSRLPLALLIDAVQWRLAAATIASRAGRADEAVRELREALLVWRVPSLTPMLDGHAVRAATLSRALEGAAAVVADLPRGADVAPLREELDEIDLDALLDRALRAERAYGWTALHRALGIDGAPPLPGDAQQTRWAVRGLSPRDLARLLERWEALLAATAEPDPAERLRRVLDVERDAARHPLVTHVGGSLRQTLEAQARLDLLRMQLTGLERGLDAAEREAAARIDPTTGAPARVSRAPDGGLEVQLGEARVLLPAAWRE